MYNINQIKKISKKILNKKFLLEIFKNYKTLKTKNKKKYLYSKFNRNLSSKRKSTSILKKNDLILITIILLIMFAGSLIGSLYGVNTKTDENIIKKYIPLLYKQEIYSIIPYFLNNIKYIIAIWICGFFEYGWGFNSAIIIFKCFIIGNISSKALIFLEKKGIIYILTTLIPNIFLLFAIFITSFFSYKMVIKSLSKPNGKMNLKREKYKTYTEYIIILFISTLFAILSSLCEVYFIHIIF